MRVKTERMEKSAKRPRENRGVLRVRNRILFAVASKRYPGKIRRDEIKEKTETYLVDTARAKWF